MDPSGRQEKHLVGLYGIGGQRVYDGMLLYHLGVFVGCDTPFQAGVEPGFSVGIVDDIPHFRFSHGMVPFLGQFVVGMNLYGEVVARIDEFDQQGERIAEPSVIASADQALAVFLDQFGQGFAGIFSVANDGFVAAHA